MPTRENPIGEYLRARRELVRPEEVGLPEGVIKALASRPASSSCSTPFTKRPPTSTAAT